MNSILQLSSDSVINMYKSRLPKGIVYHNLTHVKEAVETAIEIGKNFGLIPEELEMLLIAAWFHDAGMIYQYNSHEEKSAEVCRKFLLAQNYPSNKIEAIVEIILSTRIPQKPKNLLERIICDADLSYLGKKEFISRGELLRQEWKNMLGKNFTDSEWLNANIEFLLQNNFHTDYAKIFFDEQRNENLRILREKLKNYKITPPPKQTSLS